ncbi:uncharacterized protein LOC130839607 [Hippopotamus amphibius kiboko]|uniref:uncharacterized protein LOC130839607 n=1 Tax=Hippopotamus amphibius kiboko TaxID=575201 RepID=UPI0025914C63|nr:uncharacterized protein LOC130839607 [Hippopotamus amphibius kiboko]
MGWSWEGERKRRTLGRAAFNSHSGCVWEGRGGACRSLPGQISTPAQCGPALAPGGVRELTSPPLVLGRRAGPRRPALPLPPPSSRAALFPVQQYSEGGTGGEHPAELPPGLGLGLRLRLRETIPGVLASCPLWDGPAPEEQRRHLLPLHLRDPGPHLAVSRRWDAGAGSLLTNFWPDFPPLLYSTSFPPPLCLDPCGGGGLLSVRRGRSEQPPGVALKMLTLSLHLSFLSCKLGTVTPTS